MNSFGLLLRVFLLLGATIVIVGGGASIVRMVLIAEYNVSDRLTSLSVSEESLQDEVCKRLRLAVPSRMITLILADWRFLWHARC